ncbi:patatin-like phospholipase family protein [Caulobacter sp. KR2-114]|uniref:patatin-like phospholipase family protein n=1 Tax=Caulobacter sp. KR2-114 TaxID=3400912 RepID=UPI003C1108A3
MASLTDSLPETALTRLFEQKIRSGEAVWFSVPGGSPLFLAGEPADQLYLLRTGRLGAVRREEGHEPQFLGVIRPGEPAGEMALIAGAVHSANVLALRDSEILALPRGEFFHAAETDPEVMTQLARLMILRARQTVRRAPIGEPSVFGFMAAAPDARARDLAEAVAAAIGRLDYSVTVVGAEAQHAPTEWFSNVEHAHDFVLYAAESDEAGWMTLVGRQVDRLFRLGRGAASPPPAPDLHAGEPLQKQGLVDLVLLQEPDCAAPAGSAAWCDLLQPARLFQIRLGHAPDTERLARVITGQSVGLVLSGGGARAYAHVGAIQALHERRVPIDFVCGVSMGAIVGAGLAMGWDDAELDDRIRRAFVDTSPLDDIAFPLIAMTHGWKVRDRLAEHFGERRIEDLWLPFFCLSSNLTTGAYQLHRRGPLAEALRASIALPGILPPSLFNHEVLVDGAVMKNFPADIMRTVQLGPIVGVDVSRGRSIEAEDVTTPPSVWRWFLSGDWRRGPPIVSLLMRAATVTSGRDLAAAREATDVLILPTLDKVEIRNWKAYDPAVAAGRAATFAALDRLTTPVQDLRRRPSMEDIAGRPQAALSS